MEDGILSGTKTHPLSRSRLISPRPCTILTAIVIHERDPVRNAVEKSNVRLILWQQWLSFVYVIFFAGVAPFVCWGTASDPTHSHSGSHFVFQQFRWGESITMRHGHDICAHDLALRQNRLDSRVITEHEDHAPENRSAPVVTFVSLIALLLAAIFFFSTRWINHSRWLVLFRQGRDMLLLVPLPPPQITISSTKAVA